MFHCSFRRTYLKLEAFRATVETSVSWFSFHEKGERYHCVQLIKREGPEKYGNGASHKVEGRLPGWVVLVTTIVCMGVSLSSRYSKQVSAQAAMLLFLMVVAFFEPVWMPPPTPVGC